MKKNFLFASLFLIGFLSNALAQNTVIELTPEEYQTHKENGTIPEGDISIILEESVNTGVPTIPQTTSTFDERSGSCGCFVAPDASYTLAMGPNDDGSTGVINLPFTFCLYGNNYTSLYINNNGNVSFGAPYAAFSSSGFPSANFIMVAPFWADVDTRPVGGGQVWYKITPTAIYVNWLNVGYYSMHTDKKNNFQLILTNGSDPVVEGGNNVAFCYGEMQWTTGDASNGVNGFGGIPSTVGANRGNGIDYVQFGRFGVTGNAYDGPFGATDGIDWLDFATFKFNTCISGSNIAPILASVTPSSSSGSGSGIACGDTLNICGHNDTLVMSASFIAPESGQTISFTTSAPTLSNFQVLSTANGTITMMVVSSIADAGFHQIDIVATDNGSPPMSTTFPLTIYIDTTGLSNFDPTIIGPDTVCSNGIPVTLSTQVYDTYEWSTGSLTATTSVSVADTTWLTVGLNGCFASAMHILTIESPPVPTITGNTTYCAISGGTQLTGSGSFVSYVWTQGATVVGNTASVFLPAGTYTLTVTNSFGCVGTASVTVSVVTPTVSISTTGGTNPFCVGDSINLVATGTAGLIYSWNTGASVSAITVNTAGTYIVTGTLGSCQVTDTIVITTNPVPTVSISGNNTLCSGTIGLLVANTNAANPVFSWTGGSTNDSLNIALGGNYTVTVTDGICSAQASINVTLVQTPSGSIVGNTSFCPGSSSVLTANFNPPGTTYTWSTGETTSSIIVTTSGNYSVTANNNGCISSGNANVVVFGTPNAEFTVNPVSPFVFGTDATLTDASTVTAPDVVTGWTWFIDGAIVSTTPQFNYTFTNAGNYVVTLYIVTNNGCIDSVTHIINVVAEITIPNVFSPGTTPGANDMFVVQNLEYYPGSSLYVYNRWGQLVYSSDNYLNNWNGLKQNDGKMVSSGTYFFVLTLNDGTVHNGTVTVFGEK